MWVKRQDSWRDQMNHDSRSLDPKLRKMIRNEMEIGTYFCRGHHTSVKQR